MASGWKRLGSFFLLTCVLLGALIACISRLARSYAVAAVFFGSGDENSLTAPPPAKMTAAIVASAGQPAWCAAFCSDPTLGLALSAKCSG